MTKKASNVSVSSNLFDTTSKPRKQNRKPEAQPEAQPEDKTEDKTEKLFKQAVNGIKTLCNVLSAKTEMPYDKIKTALFELCGKNTDAITALAHNTHIYTSIISRIIDNGENMTLAIPMAYFTAKRGMMLDVERNILNIITPFKKNQVWTCGAVETRNAPTTWGVAQGCFVEIKEGIILMFPDLKEPLKTVKKTLANGEKTLAPIVTFQWTSKAARVRAFSLKAYGSKTALDECMKFYGCTQDVLDGIDKTENANTSKSSGSKATKKEQAESVKNLLLAMWDEE